MKKRSFPTIVLVLFISLFSSHAFAQPAPGDWGDGGPDGEPKSQPSPTYFKRNNGNGTCGREAEIRVAFNLIPDYFPTIREIMYAGYRINVDINPIDALALAKKGYVSYCVGSDIPPACKLSLTFNYHGSNQTFLLMEANHF